VQLGLQITLRLRKFLQDPIVDVVVNGIHSKNIYLMGETNRKGPVEMTPGMTILQALGAAGLTDNANVKKAYILRDENGVRKRIPIHYKEALKGNIQFDILLKAGDTIVVP
jgi:polysaccharide export outer membrane protein